MEGARLPAGQSNVSPPVALNREILVNIIELVFALEVAKSIDMVASHERAFLQYVQYALEKFQQLYEGADRAVDPSIPNLQGVASCVVMVQRMISTRHVGGYLRAATLKKELKQMAGGYVSNILFMAQREGFLITHRGRPDYGYFQAFDLAASSNCIPQAEGKKYRQFFGLSAAAAIRHVGHATFSWRVHRVDPLAKSVGRWSIRQEYDKMCPSLAAIITGLRNHLGGNADIASLHPAGISKKLRRNHVTDDGCHQIALWLLLRVSIQLTMEPVSLQGNSPRNMYKGFIVFFMCEILEQAVALGLPHDMLFMMLAKISRRILKLGLSEAPWLHAADKIMQDTRLTLETFWAGVQDKGRTLLDLFPLGSLDFAADTDWTLKTLRPYLKMATAGSPVSSDASTANGKDHNLLRTNDKQSLPHTEFHMHQSRSCSMNSPISRVGAEHGHCGEDDGGALISPQGTQILPDFGFLVAREVKPESLHDPLDLLDVAHEIYMGADSDAWFRVIENSAASGFLGRADESRSKPVPPASVMLCERCRALNPLAPRFQHFINPAELRGASGTCRLCRMLGRSLKRVGLPSSGRPIMIYRDGTNLKADHSTRPALRICAERELCEFKDIQVGYPSLPEAGHDYDFSPLREWINECDHDHAKFGCGKPPGVRDPPFLPTRVLDLGFGPSSSCPIRLHCTQESDRYEYVALSHCWGVPSEAEWKAVCTHRGNVEARCQEVVFAHLPRTFQDAIAATRKLGKRYLWIDSLCIIQRDEEDWEKEAALMESVFSSAYCTISATSARSFHDGFLHARPSRDYMPVPNAPSAAGPLWLSEIVDDFRADVEEGPVNRRGWVLQERVLSRRTLYFTSNQTYFECGGGVRCETMTWLWNPKAALLGDPQFPQVILKRNPADRAALLQKLFETYSAMNLTVAADKSVAISGLERRLAKNLDGITAYGVMECYLHRSLLWQRAAEKPLRRIKYPKKRSIPSWSWMAYDGAIEYLKVPNQGVEWNNCIFFPPARGSVATTAPAKSQSSVRELNVSVSALCAAEIQREPWRLSIDNPGAVDFEELASVVVVGRSRTSIGSLPGDVELYVLVVKETFMGGYQRVGAGRIQERHLAAKGTMVGRII